MQTDPRRALGVNRLFDFAHPVATTRTSADGSFELTGVTPGLGVTVRKTGFAPASASADYLRDITLLAEDPCEFLVVDEEGAPVAGAELGVYLNWGGGPAQDAALTGADGRARISIRAGGALIVRAQGFVVARPDMPASQTTSVGLTP